MKGSDLKPTDLRRDVTYVSPLGHWCRLLPRERGSPSQTFFSFEYLHDRSGFSLSAANVGLLMRVPS